MARSDRATVESSDRELLAAVAAGDQAAMGLFYDRHASAALGLARRIVGDAGLAEDVVQEAFVAVWTRAGTYRPERGEARTWLLSIVHHRAIDRWRGAAGLERCVDLDLSPPLPSPDGDVAGAALRRLERAEIAAALATLPAEQRDPIQLAFFGGRTHTEIAASTGLPLGTVKGRMRLGLMRLRRQLERSQPRPGLASRHPAAPSRRPESPPTRLVVSAV